MGIDIVNDEPFETMESVQVEDIDQYLEIILKKFKGGEHKQSGINFMETSNFNYI